MQSVFSLPCQVYDVRNKLRDLCGFPKPSFSGDDLVRHLISQAVNNPEDDRCRSSTCRSLLLLAKCQGYKWTNNHIVTRLLEVLGRCWKDCKGNQGRVGEASATSSARTTKLLFVWVIDTIGNVSRVYTFEGRDHLLALFDPIKSILQSTSEDITPDLEDSCVQALVFTGHHLQVESQDRIKPFDSKPDSLLALPRPFHN